MPNRKAEYSPNGIETALKTIVQEGIGSTNTKTLKLKSFTMSQVSSSVDKEAIYEDLYEGAKMQLKIESIFVKLSLLVQITFMSNCRNECMDVKLQTLVLNCEKPEPVVPVTPGGAVESVNGQTGDVVLDAADVGAYPDSNPSNYISASGAPVQSVNGETGTVVLDATDVGAYPDTNPSNYISASGAPVQSVNGETGTVVLDAADVGADPAGSAATALSSANSYTDSQLAGKQDVLTIGDLTSLSSGVNVTGGTGSVIGAGTQIEILVASSIQQGLLTAENFVRFLNGFYSKIINDGLIIPADNFKYVSDYCEIADGITVTLETNSTLEVG
jgi:hypothetical protein